MRPVGLIVLAIVLSACVVQNTPQMPIPDTEMQISHCEVDSDSIIVQPDCCSCYNGGVAVAINKKYEEHYKNINKKNCEQISCLAVVNPFCGSEGVCINEQCQLSKVIEMLCASEDYQKCINGTDIKDI